ncbi:MAG: Maf family protein, partial [Opitutales bacterium]|nr:Maf family protein [Opitutales bacterium]
WVIGADTVAIFGSTVFNKPKDLADAKHTLQLLSGKTHSAVTGLAIVCKTANFRYVTTVETKVTFDPIDDTFISRYLEEVKPLKSAGSYTIRHPLTQTFVHLEGSQTNVSGFPTEAFREILKTLPRE